MDPTTNVTSGNTSNTTPNVNKFNANNANNVIMTQNESDLSDPPKINKPTNRCRLCNKKLILVGSVMGVCRCGGIFCNAHKIAQDHKCTFDYKSIEERKIAKTYETGKSNDSGNYAY